MFVGWLFGFQGCGIYHHSRTRPDCFAMPWGVDPKKRVAGVKRGLTVGPSPEVFGSPLFSVRPAVEQNPKTEIRRPTSSVVAGRKLPESDPPRPRSRTRPRIPFCFEDEDEEEFQNTRFRPGTSVWAGRATFCGGCGLCGKAGGGRFGFRPSTHPQAAVSAARPQIAAKGFGRASGQQPGCNHHDG